eukprot:Gb_24355 [translate_table: standard]
MAWQHSPTNGNSPGDIVATHKHRRTSRPDLTRIGDVNQYNIFGKDWGEVEWKEALMEETGQFAADVNLPTGPEGVRLSRSGSGTLKSEDSWPRFQENPLRSRADYQYQEHTQAGRKVHLRPSNEASLRSSLSWEGRFQSKDMPVVKTSFDTDRQSETHSDKGTNLVGCKAGISGLLFSSVCSTFTKSNNSGQRRYSFGNLGCTSAPDVYIPTSATKVVRASADWNVKKVRRKTSKIDRGGGGGATFGNQHGSGSQRKVQVASQPTCHQSSAQASRKQTTPIVDPDIWCSTGLSLTTDATSSDCFVPSGNMHVCRRYRASNSSQNVSKAAGTQSDRSSRERACSTRRFENPEKLSDLVLGSDSENRRLGPEVVPIVRNRQLQGSRRSTGGLAEQLLMLEATLLLGGTDLYDQHRDWRLDVDSMSYEELLELGDRIGYVNTGLSEETIIQCLKKMKHCILEAASACFLSENERKCSICQEEYEANDELGKLDCGHSYHVCCIKQWLLQKNACPVCKASAFS